jgi:hypothetical protein
MTPEYSIGVVTYLGRYKSYFKPLIRNLHFLFPDHDINVWINGHYDQVRQIQYLKQITSFLADYPNIRYRTNLDHQSLASGWNWLILMSKCDHVLILNDDIKLYFNFRHNFEPRQVSSDIFTLNGTWSHFVISKDVVKQVGWFDERFLGIGYEDTDYAIRLALKGIPLGDVRIHGFHDYGAPQDDAGWTDISDVTRGKYSEINWQFFQRKWGVSSPSSVPEDGFLRIKAIGNEWVIKPDEILQETPEYYPMSCLDNHWHGRPKITYFLKGKLAIILSVIISHFWRIRLAGGARLRKFIGPHWDQWRKILGR